MKFFVKLLRNKKGAALVEYGLLVSGVALITAAAVSIFGSKTSDMIAATAAVLPGAHSDDNNPIISGSLIETDVLQGAGGETGIQMDVAGILANRNTGRLGNNVLGSDPGASSDSFGDLVIEP